jgi:hypothetical protein
MKQYRVRFGIRVPVFKNLGILVLKVDETTLPKVQQAFDILSIVLLNNGIEDRLVFEYKEAEPKR